MLTHLGKALGVEPHAMIEAELIPEARLIPSFQCSALERKPDRLGLSQD